MKILQTQEVEAAAHSKLIQDKILFLHYCFDILCFTRDTNS